MTYTVGALCDAEITTTNPTVTTMADSSSNSNSPAGPHAAPDLDAIRRAQQVLFEEGTKLRAQVLGTSHISSSKALSDFQQPGQEMAVAAGWALCWARPGLEPKTRSLLCLVMLSVLGRDQELSVHVRGAVNNGCSEEEIREALFQVC